MATNFELVKIALDDLHTVIARQEGANATAAIRDRLASLSSDYVHLTESRRKPIDYSSPLSRFAYVYTYVAAHGSWTCDLLLRSPQAIELLKRNEPIRATCLGGGPGTEIIGLLNASNSVGRTAPLSCFLLDGEDGWAEAWSEIDTKIQVAFQLGTSFRCVNVCNPPKFENLAKAFGADIFFTIFFLSEVYSFKDKAQPFFEELVASMKSGALVVYLDNGSKTFTEYAESIFTAKQFETLFSQDEVNLQLNPSEEKRALGAHLDKTRTPKLTQYATQRIWRKK